MLTLGAAHGLASMSAMARGGILASCWRTPVRTSRLTRGIDAQEMVPCASMSHALVVTSRDEEVAHRAFCADFRVLR